MMSEYTHKSTGNFSEEGIEVPATHHLRFMVSSEWRGWDGVLVIARIAWQRNQEGRRPYLGLSLGPLYVQIGWLWDADENTEEEKG